MRFLTGLIVGILLTIGTAYVVDSTKATAAEDKSSQKMVNWAVVSENLRGLTSEIHDAWTFFVGKAKEVDKEVEKKASS